MIAKLEGRVDEFEGDLVVVNVAGVGYGLNITNQNRANLKLGQSASFYIYEHIRETGHDLYAFGEKASKSLFEQLISVNGVGPKGALAILNLGDQSTLRAAIAGGDLKYISAASGIGQKVAERIVVDLKNKVGLVASSQATEFLHDLPQNSQDEALQALMALGYSATDAAAALRGIDSELPVDQRVKQALKGGK